MKVYAICIALALLSANSHCQSMEPGIYFPLPSSTDLAARRVVLRALSEGGYDRDLEFKEKVAYVEDSLTNNDDLASYIVTLQGLSFRVNKDGTCESTLYGKKLVSQGIITSGNIWHVQFQGDMMAMIADIGDNKILCEIGEILIVMAKR